jgi:benzoyl-CoA reductase/2-hydroxyglutaryl-CoA dehydratase subunit BcrC/BadD/HgdB
VTQPGRENRQLARIRTASNEEVGQEIEYLANRQDHFRELDYFLDLLKDGPQAVSKRTGRPLAALLCLQAPLELLHAYGLQPFKLFGGSSAQSRLAAPSLPAIMCPMLRSAVGALCLEANDPDGALTSETIWILPTTCDWSVKFPVLAERIGLSLGSKVHRLELPHLKDRPESQERWLEEVYHLNDFLRKNCGLRKTPRKDLSRSLDLYQRAWRALVGLSQVRRQGKAPAIWALTIANSFFFDSIERWTDSLEKALTKFKEKEPGGSLKKVFLAGSPIFFPNLKLLRLFEEAGLEAVIDDLCSSERLFPGAVHYDDPSEHGLLKALAQRYHQSCLCPTFSDNDRRINSILAPSTKNLFEGVVYHVLKGCHPFDLESLQLEGPLKAHGLKFLRLETDYTAEDSQNLLTRLEAFRGAMS